MTTYAENTTKQLFPGNAALEAARRIGRLMRVFAITQKRTIAVSAGAVYAVLLALFLLGLLTGTGWGTGLEYHEVFFNTAFVLAGFIAASMSFTGMHRADRSYTYLTLPASHLEKLAEKLLLTAVVYPLLAVLSYFVYSLLLAGLAQLLAGESFAVFNPVAPAVFEVVRGYVVVSSVFLFGAAYFRGRHFIKTVLAVAGIFALLALIATAAGFAALADIFRGIEAGTYARAAIDPARIGQLTELSVRLARIAKLALLWVLPPVMWLLTWLRLRETEVSDAVR
jgi:hypothetical protein